MNIRKSASALVRDALQILHTHPAVIEPVRRALIDVQPIPHWRDGGLTAWQARNDCLLLKALNWPDDYSMIPYAIKRVMKLIRKGKIVTGKGLTIVHGMNYFHQEINKRASLKACIDRCAVNGMIGIVESGRDCDCVEYTHSCQPIPATVFAYHKLQRDKSQWADGPFELFITTPQEAEATQSESRDLVLEAFEDGHPHSIVSRYP